MKDGGGLGTFWHKRGCEGGESSVEALVRALGGDGEEGKDNEGVEVETTKKM